MSEPTLKQEDLGRPIGCPACGWTTAVGRIHAYRFAVRGRAGLERLEAFCYVCRRDRLFEVLGARSWKSRAA